MDPQEQEFWRAIEAAPDEMTVRLAFADWLDEQGDERGPGMRVIGHGRHMVDFYPGERGGDDHWTWFDRQLSASTNGLPTPWFVLLTCQRCHYASGNPGGDIERGLWRDYDTRAEAESDAARAFALLPPDVQAELLRPQEATV